MYTPQIPFSKGTSSLSTKIRGEINREKWILTILFMNQLYRWQAIWCQKTSFPESWQNIFYVQQMLPVQIWTNIFVEKNNKKYFLFFLFFLKKTNYFWYNLEFVQPTFPLDMDFSWLFSFILHYLPDGWKYC